MLRSMTLGRAALAAGMILGVGTAAHAQGSGSATLDAVKARGQLVCGVTTGRGRLLACRQPGHHPRAGRGRLPLHRGGRVRRRQQGPLHPADHHQPLQPPCSPGEIDVLIRETTWTLGREANLGLEFTGVNYYDGTGFLVKTAANVKGAKELDGATVCVEPGTSTELAISDYFRNNKMKFTPVEIQDASEIQKAFLSGRCDAYSTDSSALAGFRFQQGAKASELTLLPEIISKEPLGPMVRKGDDKWFDLVKWTHFALLTAEENGITQANVDTIRSATPTRTSAG